MNGLLPVSALPRLALSIRQPWAELILLGRKTIEVRNWSTTHRGAVALHTGLQPDSLALQVYADVDISALGAFIGSFEIAKVERFNHASWSRLRPFHLVPGSMPDKVFAWHLVNPRRLELPVSAPGQLGLFPTPTQNT